jgi:hypothetical protein
LKPADKVFAANQPQQKLQNNELVGIQKKMPMKQLFTRKISCKNSACINSSSLATFALLIGPGILKLPK